MYWDTAWIKDAQKELAGAKHAVLTSYVFNNVQMHATLCRNLRRPDFTCSVLVDDDGYTNNKASNEKRLLGELKYLGAQVCLCSGRARGGIFHWKALLLDSRILYWGTANFTQATLNHRDLMQRLTGPAINDVKEGIDDAVKDCKYL